MIFVSSSDHTKGGRGNLVSVVLLIALALLALPATGWTVPSRLVIALDGVAYRDMQALQAGVTRTNFWGKKYQLRAFTAAEGYFPASRMISTFPSASDVAWTDIFGDHPLPGYQRTYYSAAANSLIVLNGVTTTVEHERQMDWQAQNGLIRALGYLCPVHTFRYEMKGMEIYFWKKARSGDDFYAYLRASDDAQHLDRDIFALLCEFDGKLNKLRAEYKAREGHDLQIVILSDHGHNHAGRGIHVRDNAFFKKAGYRVVRSIQGPKDVVLPIVGVESWVEVHCLPGETEKLASLLCGLEGADLVVAGDPNDGHRFFVMNTKGERADIDWNPGQNSFRYSPVSGDPIHYQAVVEALAQNHRLDANGFASADDWMAATVVHHYPLALERIVRGLTRGALNPATIIVSLDNRYVNDNWFTDLGSRLVTCRSTHGGLDDICSDGILLSNFAPTRDTSTDRVAAQFNNFTDVKNFRAGEGGGELVTRNEEALQRIPHVAFDHEFQQLLGDGVYLRIWSPRLAEVDGRTPVSVAIEKASGFHFSSGQRVTFDHPLSLSVSGANERIYALPTDLKLKPLTEYSISGWLQAPPGGDRLFNFSFFTGKDGEPAAF